MQSTITKGVIIYLFITILLLSGCGRNMESKEAAMGRYVEKDFEFPPEIGDGWVTQKEDGTMEIANSLDSPNPEVYDLKVGGNWEKVGTHPINWPKDMKNCMGLNVVERENIILYANEQDEIKIYADTGEGTCLGISLKEHGKPIKVEETDCYLFRQADSGDYLFQKEWCGCVKCYDGKTGEMKYAHEGDIFSFDVNGNEFYEARGFKERIVAIYDISTGKMKRSIDYTPGTGNIIARGKDKGEIYLANSNGIFHLSKDGELWEQMMEPNGTSFNSVEMTPRELYVQGESFIVLFVGQREGKWERYDYDPNVVSKPTKEPRSPFEAMFAASALEKRGGGKVSNIEVGGKAVFKECVSLGINANSKKQEMAKEIMEIMFSDEVQTLANGWGMPISKVAIENQKKELVGFSNCISDDQGRKLVLNKSLEDYYKEFESCYMKASIPTRHYEDLYFNLQGILLNYCRGELTDEEVSNSIGQLMEYKFA